MNILITRPEHDAAAMKARIEAMGHTVLCAPLLAIKFLSIDADAITGAAALIATSRNALRALAASKACDRARGIDIFTVGKATAATARDLGFTKVIEGPGSGAALADTIVAHSVDHSAPLIHIAGDHLAFNIEAALAGRGLNVTKIQAYRSVAAKTFPQDVTKALSDNAIDAVILMSPRTAATWAALASALPGKPDLTRITHMCLSAKVAAALPQPLQCCVVIAENPQIEEIFALLYRLAGDNKNR